MRCSVTRCTTSYSRMAYPLAVNCALQTLHNISMPVTVVDSGWITELWCQSTHCTLKPNIVPVGELPKQLLTDWTQWAPKENNVSESVTVVVAALDTYHNTCTPYGWTYNSTVKDPSKFWLVVRQIYLQPVSRARVTFDGLDQSTNDDIKVQRLRTWR